MEQSFSALKAKLKSLPAIKKADAATFDGDEIIIKKRDLTTLRFYTRFLSGVNCEVYYAKGSKRKEAYGYLGDLLYVVEFENTQLGWDAIIDFVKK